jgi:hypothetical protein
LQISNFAAEKQKAKMQMAAYRPIKAFTINPSRSRWE